MWWDTCLWVVSIPDGSYSSQETWIFSQRGQQTFIQCKAAGLPGQVVLVITDIGDINRKVHDISPSTESPDVEEWATQYTVFHWMLREPQLMNCQRIKPRMGEAHVELCRWSSRHLVHSKATFAAEPSTGSLSLLPNLQVHVSVPK